MIIEIAPDRGEVKVTVIDNGLDISHTKIEAKTRFEVPSSGSVIYIEPIKMGTEPKPDPQMSFAFLT